MPECPKTPIDRIKGHKMGVHRVYSNVGGHSVEHGHSVQLSLPSLSLPKNGESAAFELPQAVFTKAATASPRRPPLRAHRPPSTSPFAFSLHSPLLDPFRPDHHWGHVAVMKTCWMTMIKEINHLCVIWTY